MSDELKCLHCGQPMKHGHDAWFCNNDGCPFNSVEIGFCFTDQKELYRNICRDRELATRAKATIKNPPWSKDVGYEDFNKGVEAVLAALKGESDDPHTKQVRK